MDPDGIRVEVNHVPGKGHVVRDAKLDYPILSDPAPRTADAYGVRHAGEGPDGQDIAHPASVLIDGAGVVRWTSVTRNFRVRPDAGGGLGAIDALRPARH